MIKEYHAGDEQSAGSGSDSAPKSRDRKILEAIYLVAASTLEIIRTKSVSKSAKPNCLEGSLVAIFVTLDRELPDAGTPDGDLLAARLDARVAELKLKILTGELPG